MPSPRPPPIARAERALIATANQRMLASGSLTPGVTQLHTPPPSLLPPVPPSGLATSLTVADCDAATAAMALYQLSAAMPPAILNFANAERRGGGYVTGASAQEEDLCRAIPALYPALRQVAYPLDPAVVPTTVVAICRDPHTYALLPSPSPAVVVTAAALDMRQHDDAGRPRALPSAAAYSAEMRRRVRCVLYAIYAAGCRDLVLGPWGCGVFANDAVAIASLFEEALASSEWRGRFANVVFAVPRARRGTVNDIFRRGLAPLARA